MDLPGRQRCSRLKGERPRQGHKTEDTRHFHDEYAMYQNNRVLWDAAQDSNGMEVSSVIGTVVTSIRILCVHPKLLSLVEQRTKATAYLKSLATGTIFWSQPVKTSRVLTFVRVLTTRLVGTASTIYYHRAGLIYNP